MKKINVLLATYNGSKYLTEQVNSVLANFEYLKGYDCKIIISDDASTDDTVSIIEGICEKCSEVTFLGSERKGGVKSNFQYLIMNSDADYIFFCDQDDLWLPMKMKIFIENFHKLEDEGLTKILLHSDLCVADKNLSPIHVSMFQYQCINDNPSFSQLLISNSVTGCVMAIDKYLLDVVKAGNINNSIMHDWYIALIAITHGALVYIPKSLILYRQHENNQVGAKSFSLSEIFKISSFKLKVESAIRSINKTKSQATIFKNNFSDAINPYDLDILNRYIDSFNGNFLQRLELFVCCKMKKKGFLRNIVFFSLYVFGMCGGSRM